MRYFLTNSITKLYIIIYNTLYQLWMQLCNIYIHKNILDFSVQKENNLRCKPSAKLPPGPATRVVGRVPHLQETRLPASACVQRTVHTLNKVLGTLSEYIIWLKVLLFFEELKSRLWHENEPFGGLRIKTQIYPVFRASWNHCLHTVHIEKALREFHYIGGNQKEHVSHLLRDPYKLCMFCLPQEGSRFCPFQYVVVGRQFGISPLQTCALMT